MRFRVPAVMAAVLLSLSCAFVAEVDRASAAPVVPPDTVKDAGGDVSAPQGDLLGAGYVATSTSLVFGMKVEAPTDPATDPAWASGREFVHWQLDTDGDDSPDYNITIFPDHAGGMNVQLDSVSTFDICDGTGTYIPTYGYTATFAKLCLSAGLKFRFQGLLSFTAADQGALEQTDFAPGMDTGCSRTGVACSPSATRARAAI